MNSKRLSYTLTSLVVVLCLGLLFGAHTVAGIIAKDSNNLVSLQLKEQSLNDQIAQLQQTKADAKKYAPLAAIAKSIVPQDKNQAEAVREIVNLAKAAGVTISQISFPKSSLDSTQAPSSAAKSKINLSQLSPVNGISGVYSLPITVMDDPTQPVSYSQFINFLSSLENNRRTAQVTDISLQPDPKNPSQLSFSLSINEYIKP